MNEWNLPFTGPLRSDPTLDKLAQLQRIATALALDVSLQQMAELVNTECQAALAADAICTYLLNGDTYEMVAHRGCTPEFIDQFGRVPKSAMPIASAPNLSEGLFIGDPEEFRREMPSASTLIDRSGRKTIGYASLMVNSCSIGIIGFSYNSPQERPAEREFIIALVNVCAQALERVRLSERERAAKLQAEEANRAKSEFLANVSHEIRTPLGLIQGYTDLLFEAEGLTEQQRHWASIVRRNTRQLNAMIGEVLDIAKIEAEKVEIERVLFSLPDLIEDVRLTSELRAQEKGLSLRFLTHDIPESIHSDPMRLRQILLNLIGNAIKFTPKGGVEAYIRILADSRMEVLVKDSGIGIAPEHHQEIFKPFTQGDTSTRRRFGGTGLGLAIAKQVAKALGGDVTLVRSSPGEGSTFMFSMACKAEPAAKAHASPKISELKHPLEGLRILFVEDSIDNRELVGHILRAAGAQVDMADSGRRGIDMALANHYDAVLMDIQMPELDGREAVFTLRGRGYKRPIAALTAHALISERERSLREGFDAYLTKPIDPPLLIRTLRRLADVHSLH